MVRVFLHYIGALMVKSFGTFLLVSCFVLFFAQGCRESSLTTNPLPTAASPALHLAPLAEGFETGSKTAYAAADVALGSGTWNLNDALIGTSASDVKNGTAAARVRNSGTITMKFDRTNGAGTVTILHAKYGTDGNSTWQLWYSTNSGSTWTQTGATITTSTTTLQTASFTVNLGGNIRFEIRKTDASANRLNIDDIGMNDYAPNNPVPTIAAMSPTYINSGSASFTITVTGNNFVASSVVKWNGTALTTTYISASTLQATVPAANVASTGTAPITVYTPAPGGGTTSSLTFTVIPASANVNTTMGNPSGAVHDVNFPANYLIERGQYCMSYNRDRGLANWVAWQLNSTWITGSAVDKDQFKTDVTLPAGWYEPTYADYTNSGFSRGHQCPSADRKNTQANMDTVYLMSNIMPQTQAKNGGGWEGLETYCRTLAGQGNVLYIYAGSCGTGGTGLNGYKTSLANGSLTVPAKMWKVIMVLPAGTNDLSRVTTSTRTIAIVMNNDTTSCPTNSWGNYRVSVDSIESLTGLDFFSNVSPSIQSVIEASVDNGPTQ